MPSSPIETIQQLAGFRRQLRALGYKTLEQFLGAAQASGGDMGRYLNADINAVLATLQAQYAPLVSIASVYLAAPPKFPLGVALEKIPRARPGFGIPSLATLPPQVNLVAQMPAVKDQGARGTCVAFASLAAVEHYACVQGAYRDLSEQFLYWNCKANDGSPNSEGTWLQVSFAALQRDGCCLAATWPDDPNLIAGNEGQGPPPVGAQGEAINNKVATINSLAPTSVQALKGELARGRCVAFDIPVFNSWYLNNQVTLSGDIVVPIPGEQNAGGHAMCLVGYNDDPADVDVGGGRFILRNSWDSKWGTQSLYGAGYGTIPYSYIASYAMEAYSVY